jgi:hypothetical protein
MNTISTHKFRRTVYDINKNYELNLSLKLLPSSSLGWKTVGMKEEHG